MNAARTFGPIRHRGEPRVDDRLRLLLPAGKLLRIEIVNHMLRQRLDRGQLHLRGMVKRAPHARREGLARVFVDCRLGLLRKARIGLLADEGEAGRGAQRHHQMMVCHLLQLERSEAGKSHLHPVDKVPLQRRVVLRRRHRDRGSAQRVHDPRIDHALRPDLHSGKVFHLPDRLSRMQIVVRKFVEGDGLDLRIFVRDRSVRIKVPKRDGALANVVDQEGQAHDGGLRKYASVIVLCGVADFEHPVEQTVVHLRYFRQDPTRIDLDLEGSGGRPHDVICPGLQPLFEIVRHRRARKCQLPCYGLGALRMCCPGNKRHGSKHHVTCDRPHIFLPRDSRELDLLLS